MPHFRNTEHRCSKNFQLSFWQSFWLCQSFIIHFDWGVDKGINTHFYYENTSSEGNKYFKCSKYVWIQTMNFLLIFGARTEVSSQTGNNGSILYSTWWFKIYKISFLLNITILMNIRSKYSKQFELTDFQIFWIIRTYWSVFLMY